MNAKYRTQIIKDTLDRWPKLPLNGLAKYLINSHPELFNTKEEARSALRYHAGRNGQEGRDKLTDKTHMRFGKAKMPPTWRIIREDYHLNPGLWLILSDIHVPFHEPKPIEQGIKYGQMEGVTGVLLNGDLHDCDGIKFWEGARRDFKRETELVIDFLNLICDEFPTQQKVYKIGNHEERMKRLYAQHEKMFQFIDMPYLGIETVLGLEDRGFDVVDNLQIIRAGKLPLFHGHELRNISTLVNPARGLFLRTKSFAACSHCHATSEHPETNIDGTLLTCWSFGCLCDLHPDYNPYNTKWNWGFALVNVEKDGNFEVINKRITDTGMVV